VRNGHRFPARAEVHSKDVVDALRSGAHPKPLSWRERFARWWLGFMWGRGGKW